MKRGRLKKDHFKAVLTSKLPPIKEVLTTNFEIANKQIKRSLPSFTIIKGEDDV